VLEFFRGAADCAAMVGIGDFPQLRAWCCGVDEAGVTDGDVAVDLAVDQEDWNMCRGCGILGRDFGHIKAVLPARA